MTRRRASAGFTLLELLVAMAIFAIVGVLAIGGLNAVVDQQRLAIDNMERLNRLQSAVRILTDDLYQLHPRTVRDVLGQGTELPLVADGTDDYLLRLTRGGWRNPAGFPRASLQRVQYRLEEDVLIREYWPVLDTVLGQDPEEQELLDDVDEVEFTYLDYSNEWLDQWPPPRGNPGDWPRAIRVAIELQGLGRIERLIEVAG